MAMMTQDTTGRAEGPSAETTAPVPAPCKHGETSGCFDCLVDDTGGPTVFRLKAEKRQDRHARGSSIGPATDLIKQAGLDERGFIVTGRTPTARAAGDFRDATYDDRRDPMDDEEYALGGAAARDVHAEEQAERADQYGWEQSYSARANLATEKQVRYLSSLLEQRGTEMQRTVDPEALTKWEASRFIDDLLHQPVGTALPSSDTARNATALADGLSVTAVRDHRGDGRAVPASNALPDVPEGYYAIVEGGVIHFYRYDRPNDGKWAGWTFLKVQASEDFYPVKNYGRKRDVLVAIAANVDEARMRYATELGRCYSCGRTLTDEVSRSLGIGPICRGA